MAISLLHTTIATGVDAGNGEIRKAQWNQEHTLTLASSRLIGRTTASTGVAEEIAVGNGLTLSALTLALGTPSTLTGSTTNATTSTSHTHAIVVDLGVTGGTTTGPTITSSAGTSAVIPIASAVASGVVTTASQTFAGAKTFNSGITLGVAAYGIGTAAVPALASLSNTGVGIFFTGTSNELLGFSVNTVEQMRLTTTGLGIGTSTPGVKLDVVGDARANGIFQNVHSTANKWQFQSVDGTGASTGGIFYINSEDRLYFANEDVDSAWFVDNTNYVGVRTNFTERLRVTNGGNVGIGTDAPLQRLHIKGATFSSFMQENTNGGTDEKLVDLLNNATAYSIRFLNDAGSAGRTAYQITRSGYTPTVHAWNTAVSGNPVERMRITSSGLVGVGTSTPAALLDVAGALWSQTKSYDTQGAVTNYTTTSTLTGADMISTVVRWSGAVGTLTTPTGTDLEAALPFLGTNMAWTISFLNTGSGALTVNGNTGVTRVGSATVNTATAVMYRMRRTGTNAYEIIRMAG